MKSITRILAVVMLMLATAFTANAQFKFGPRIGLEVNQLHFNSDLFDGDNRAGFTGGLQAEFMIPAIGFGFDASVMYVRRDAKFINEIQTENDYVSVSRDYISIPVNLKYKLSIPVVSNIMKPYVFTGPEFAFLTSRKAINEAWSSKKVDTSWNVGLGLEFINHLQVSASYGFGISKAAEHVGITESTTIEGKNKYWTVTAAWLF